MANNQKCPVLKTSGIPQSQAGHSVIDNQGSGADLETRNAIKELCWMYCPFKECVYEEDRRRGRPKNVVTST